MSTRTPSAPAPAPHTGRRGFSAGRLVGIAFLVAYAGSFVIMSMPPYVYEGSTLADFATAHGDDGRTNLTVASALIIAPLAGILLVWFAARMRTAVRDVRGGSTAGTVGVFGATLAAIGGIIAAAASSAGAHVATGTPDGGFAPDATLGYGLEMLSSQVLSATLVGFSILLIAFGVALRRARRIPGWLAWVGYVLAPVMPIAWMIGMIPLLVAVIWVAVVGVLVDTGTHD